MTRRRTQSSEKPLLSPITQLVLFCILSLITIGNLLRIVFSALVRIATTLTKIAKALEIGVDDLLK